MNMSKTSGRSAAPAGRGSHRFLLANRTRDALTAIGARAIGRTATVPKLALVLAGALALTIGASSGASAAAPIANEHNMFTDTFADQVCDIPGTSTVNVVDNYVNIITKSIEEASRGEQHRKTVLEQVEYRTRQLEELLQTVKDFQEVLAQLKSASGSVVSSKG